MSDHPWEQIVETVQRLIKDDPRVRLYQKFTCAGCGERLGIDEPNVFYEQGTCDRCDAVTDIKRQGCNYMAMWSLDDEKIVRMPQTREEYDRWLVYHGRPKLTDEEWGEIVKGATQ